ncbi:hypothetical protein [Tenacibaculum sp.]|uniref:hypothetical protein n=1 Tax=Tenacibaculum sp. TaxID=1906242 RepID=UPI003AA87EA0
MKTKIKIAVIAMIGLGLGTKAQEKVMTENGAKPYFIYKEGKIGIGTISPNAKLDVRGNISITGSEEKNDSYISQLKFINLYTTTSPMASIGVKTRKSVIAPFDYSNIVFNTSNGYNTLSEKMRIADNGNVGIGTNTPESKLHIKGNSSMYSTIENTVGDSKIVMGAVTNRNIIYSRKLDNAPQVLKLQVSNENDFVINTNGKIGVGTTITGSHKLAVEGSIGAREIKVEGSGWSDFVFEKSYKLPSLENVEKHIEEKGHLKDIPSAEEVEKNGFYLGEMDAKLLQKIEELTLYTIQQEKEIKELKKQNSKVNKQQKELEELKTLVKNLLKTKN